MHIRGAPQGGAQHANVRTNGSLGTCLFTDAGSNVASLVSLAASSDVLVCCKRCLTGCRNVAMSAATTAGSRSQLADTRKVLAQSKEWQQRQCGGSAPGRHPGRSGWGADWLTIELLQLAQSIHLQDCVQTQSNLPIKRLSNIYTCNPFALQRLMTKMTKLQGITSSHHTIHS